MKPWHEGRLRRLGTVLLLLGLCVLSLAGCGSQTLSRTLPDGATVTIRCEKTSALMRTAHFDVSAESLSMHFNGTTWYRARILTAGEAEALTKGKPEVAHSGNIRVYQLAEDAAQIGDPQDPESDPTHLYLMKLAGTADGFVGFFNFDPPDCRSYGSDFTTNIRYFVGKTETIPDEEYRTLP